MMRGLEARLRVLEEHGVSEVGAPLAPRSVPAVNDVIRQILGGRITRATSLNEPPPGEEARMLLSAHRGLSSGGGEVNALVVAAAEHNLDKLVAAHADERHLFVWIVEDEAELEMFSLPPPAAAPNLPEGIDVVWAATHGHAEG
jgi:hypothetical protein